MKMPKAPPPLSDLLSDIQALGPEGLQKIFGASTVEPLPGRYLHWDDLLRREPPDELDHRTWWLGIRMRRKAGVNVLPLNDKLGRPFEYIIVDPIPERLHLIDLGAGGLIGMPEQITNPDTRDRYYVSSLIEEAITSSQLEGATTTRLVAEAMIRAGRKPSDRSEQMIHNNYYAMRLIAEVKDQPLTKELIFELHRIVTDATLDDMTAAGRFRKPSEPVVVSDVNGTVFHHPPAAQELSERLAALCDFANSRTPDYFVHPVIRAIVTHFWLAYDHPFVDGNGRTARALFYWSMLHNKFWLSEFISISEVILKGPSKYSRAFLLTETDGNDLTYFIIYHLEVIRRALDSLHAYIKRTAQEIHKLEGRLKGLTFFNHRQRAFLAHALRHPSRWYNIKSHRMSHNVSYQTARADLLELKAHGLLEATKRKNTWFYEAPPDLEDRLRQVV
jgi:Fic family protein